MSEPVQSASSAHSLWLQAKKVGEVAGWLAALVGSVVTIVKALPVISTAVAYLNDEFLVRHTENTAIFVSDDEPFANQFLSILAEIGFKTQYEPLDELDNVARSASSSIVFVHKAQFRITDPIPIDDQTRDRLTRTKIIGIGSFGAYFIRKLDGASMLGTVAHGSGSTAVLDDPSKPKGIGAELPTGDLINLYQQSNGASISAAEAYDSGSTAKQMAQGVARETDGQPKNSCKGAHWTVAIQGNFALWGYEAPASLLTSEGRQIFSDLAVHLRDVPYVRFERQFSVTKPGTLPGHLGCGLTEQTYRFRPTSAGTVIAKATSDAPIALILNAPDKVNAIARQDGTHPEVSFPVHASDLRQRGYWTVRLAFFGDVRPDTDFKYTLNFDYPYSERHLLGWLIGTVIAVVLGAMALVRLAYIARKRARQSHPFQAG